MIDFLLAVALLIAQLIPIWIIHNQVANNHEKKVGWWLASLGSSLLGSLIFNYYWWLMLFPFFLIHEYKQKIYQSFSFIYFVAIYSVFIPILLINLMTLFLYTLPLISYVNDNEISWILWSVVGTIVIHIGLAYIIKINFSVLQRNDSYVKNKIILPFNIVLTIGFLLFLIPYTLERISSIQNELHGYTQYIFFIYSFLFINLLLFLSLQAKKFLQREFQKVKEEQYEQLNRYTQEIEQLYQHIRGFRHDFGNILASLGESINTGQIDEIQRAYQDILVQANLELNRTNYNIAELANVSNTAIKSVLSAKILLAEQKGIHVHMEIKNMVDSFIMETLDYVRILSILIDNAMEAAELSEKKVLEIAIFVYNMQVVTIISNSRIRDNNLTIEKIFDTNFSTKGLNHGMGLSNVRTIMEKYPSATIDTQINETELIQTLIIREKESLK